jgi:carboxylate-amine ligase
VQGPDRAIAVCDWMRELLPTLLAVSANSPFLDRRDTGLHTVRTQIFTRNFPRCGIPSPFRAWAEYAEFVELLNRVGSAVESTQLWWSVRPHHTFGTVEVRICDAQTRAAESEALAGLIAACVAQTAMALDDGESGGEPLADRQIEENLWRAIRYGLDGELIDFRRGVTVPARAAVEELLQWTQPAQAALGIAVDLPEQNGAQRALAALAGGASIPEIYRATLAETTGTYGAAAPAAEQRAAPHAASGGG